MNDGPHIPGGSRWFSNRRMLRKDPLKHRRPADASDTGAFLAGDAHVDVLTGEAAAVPFGIHTVSGRFLITFAAQASKSVLSFLTGLVIARSLGPTEFGNFAFLLGSFAGLRLVLDLSSSQAFFTLAARRQRSRSFYLYYVFWLMVGQIGVPLLCLTVLLPGHAIDALWQSQSRDRVWLAFLASTMQYLFWPQVIQLGEIVRRTYLSQSLTIAISSCHLLVIAALHIVGWLTVPIILAATAAEFLVGTALAVRLLPRPWRADDTGESFASVFNEFRTFCQPLVVSAVLTAANGWAETWMLQHFAGPVAQGYYSLGIQFSLVSLVATTALQNIFWREMAELEERSDQARVHRFYLKTSRILLLTAAAPTCFAVAWAPEIVNVALGSQYREGAPVVAVLFLYPIGQCLYSIAIIMFSVMRQTRALSIFASCNMVLNMIIGYLVLAPASAPVPGLGLGTYGLAAKLILLSFAYVLVLEYWIFRRKGWRHDWGQRLQILGIVITTSMVGRLIADMTLPWLSPVEAMCGAGILFATVIGSMIFWRPELAGIPVDLRDAILRQFRR